VNDKPSRDPVDVGRHVAHHAAVVVADVPDADVVAPDDEDVRRPAGRRSGLLLSLGRSSRQRRGHRQRRGECYAGQKEVTTTEAAVRISRGGRGKYSLGILAP
jgi:hypothetical protein